MVGLLLHITRAFAEDERKMRLVELEFTGFVGHQCECGGLSASAVDFVCRPALRHEGGCMLGRGTFIGEFGARAAVGAGHDSLNDCWIE